jgi:hypothetical protein
MSLPGAGNGYPLHPKAKQNKARPDQQFARSEIALRQTGYMALIQSLGYADAIRFLIQISPGQGDYLEWQEHIFGDVSADELYEQAREHWQSLQKQGQG